MKAKSFFRRDIVCDTIKLKKKIKHYTKYVGFDSFIDILKLTGFNVCAPVNLSNLKRLDEYHSSFNCVTSLNEKFTITIDYGGMLDMPEIWISKEGGIRRFEINPINHNVINL